MSRVKRKEHENLSDANILKVKNLLESDSPITKKEACQILNISYNTTRLQKIIDEYNERQQYVEKQKAKRRGKPASDVEIQQAVEDYLNGDNYANIAKRLFRSAGFVKAIIDRVGVPQRPVGDAGGSRDFLPDACISEEFQPGEIVWSAKYHRPAKVIREVSSTGDHLGKVYSIYILEHVDDPGPWFGHVTKGGYFAYQPAYDLGKLSHLKEFGVNLEKI